MLDIPSEVPSFIVSEIPTSGDGKKREILPRLNAITANVWGADQVKNREIMIENVWKMLPGDGSQKREVSGQN